MAIRDHNKDGRCENVLRAQDGKLSILSPAGLAYEPCLYIKILLESFKTGNKAAHEEDDDHSSPVHKGDIQS